MIYLYSINFYLWIQFPKQCFKSYFRAGGSDGKMVNPRDNLLHHARKVSSLGLNMYKWHFLLDLMTTSWNKESFHELLHLISVHNSSILIDDTKLRVMHILHLHSIYELECDKKRPRLVQCIKGLWSLNHFAITATSSKITLKVKWFLVPRCCH
jgi:hypothetical protein